MFNVPAEPEGDKSVEEILSKWGPTLVVVGVLVVGFVATLAVGMRIARNTEKPIDYEKAWLALVGRMKSAATHNASHRVVVLDTESSEEHTVSAFWRELPGKQLRQFLFIRWPVAQTNGRMHLGVIQEDESIKMRRFSMDELESFIVWIEEHLAKYEGRPPVRNFERYERHDSIDAAP